ncbi:MULTISPECIES: GNAT family N-acetyltransferase [unclassified Streptomyces]|uniref:GNAT family N-acetyltransferase n=1 Tax=unclassified Streptomyces TaxID=2593676 RepID=UPI0016613528|nr:MULTISPECIES: GNAT family N-acetyltransferase [unclassified Streptomyces]MBD0707788.1 GNAT family N-acetyltransferase [Streptomyces sp. CBMA291]MBD0713031.1 GNAT family N-acetyltransferase [Streptomyces sp. CBMA370]
MPLTPSRESALSVRRTTADDPLARPLLDELAHEYTTRYGRADDLSRYPAAEFAAPHGAFLLLLERDDPVAGGAYRRYDEHTAELKRIWTHSAHRRRGLARRVLAALERDAAERGYSRIYLTTGPRQPEAKHLYLASGYRPLFDVSVDPESIGSLPFEKYLENPKP